MELSKNKIKYIQSLKDKKKRNEYGVFVAEGNKIVLDLLPVMKCQLLIATSDFVSQNSIDPAIETIVVPRSDLNKVSFQKTPQHVLAVFYQPALELNTNALAEKLCLVLDGVQDPGNLGTIVRLADWYGIEDVICSLDTADIFNPKVVQATMGALARVRVHYKDIPDFMSELNDIPIYGTFLDGENMYEADITNTGLIVMGNEGNGISAEVEKCVSGKLYIPSYPLDRDTSESLNVAVATAIICTEFRRRFN